MRAQHAPAATDKSVVSKPKPGQLALPLPRTWGGVRAGAGRPSKRARPNPAHSRRPDHDGRHPVHVTLRAVPDAPSLRSPRTARSRPLDRRGGFPRRLRPRHSEPRDSMRARGQPRGATKRAPLESSLSCPRAPHSHRGQARDDLCAPQRPQASPRRTGSRSAKLRDLVRGVGQRTASKAVAAPRRDAAHVARVGRLATSGWRARRPRDTGGDTVSAARGHARREEAQRAVAAPSAPASGRGGSHHAWVSMRFRSFAASGVPRSSTRERT